MPSNLKRLRKITSYSGHAKFLAECDSDGDGQVAVVKEIPRLVMEPYRFGPTQCVYRWNGNLVVVAETGHKLYEVFKIPEDDPCSAT